MSDKASTRANVPPPARKSFLPNAPVPAVAANNMRGDKIVPMTFNMPQDWHTRFKVTATMNGMNMKELLVQCFEAWEREQGKK